MSNLEQLYRQVIMDHYKNPRNKGLLDDESYYKVHYDNPSCGDDLTVQLKLNGESIEDIRHLGTGCSISMSGASVMSQELKGKNITQAKEIINNFYTMIKGEDFDTDIDLGDAQAYLGVAKFPARIKCATLAWKAIEKAIDEYK